MEIRTIKNPYPYPSRFGSHSSMVVKIVGHHARLRDERGDYITSPENIDNGLADPYRYSGRRVFQTGHQEALS